MIPIFILLQSKATLSSLALQMVGDSRRILQKQWLLNIFYIKQLFPYRIRLQDFARMFSSKLGLREEELQRSLWGDNYFNTKTKTVTAGAQEKAKKPLFVQVVLENLWSVYDSVVIRKDKIMTEKIVQNLQLQINPRDLKHSDPKVQIHAILSKWLPLSDTVLRKCDLRHLYLTIL